eukprot:Em0014g98a
MSSARTPVRPLGTGEDSERRVSSPFLSSSRSLLQPADSRRQESAAGSTGNVNVQILAAIKSLQEQVADLQAKSTQPAASSIEQCAVSKKAPKELLTSIHSVVRHLRERLDAPMQWDTSSGFSSPENMRVTSEIVTACVNEKYPASVVQKATKKYFTTLKRRSRLQTNNKLPDARKKQRRLQRKHHKLQNRKVALSGSTTLTQEQKEKFFSILRIEYMSSEESAEESGEDEHMGERLKVLLIHTLPWRNPSVNEMFQSLDRKSARKRTSRAAEMCRKRCRASATEPSSPSGFTAKPPPSCPAWAKVSDC